uniref:Uncharacterized protein n=1 Tax=Arundo donax TaxID=35708 RepID=A0A0A8YL11_ARUDO
MLTRMENQLLRIICQH